MNVKEKWNLATRHDTPTAMNVERSIPHTARISFTNCRGGGEQREGRERERERERDRE